ncbi:hypothetical protein [uncultured Cohaesibacter sp.]|uniref:hypothetical protein n=1 Tax=uncultured Cohaesibacter sp. TaxID=1002546 RepID=UPI0029306F8E|nr:hypothetical protein [uncultured Cohaesibacter sp.]
MADALVACEQFGTVLEALLEAGYNAFSCDIEPAQHRHKNRHITDDVRNHLDAGWDLLVVAHPPCTRNCRSGRRWLSGPGKMTPPKKLPKGRTWESLIEEFEAGVELFSACWNAPVPHIAVENPEMHDLAKDRMPDDLPKPQIVQPHQFGHPEFKATGLYLKNLPSLVPTNQLKVPEKGSDEWKAWNRVHRLPPGPERSIERSRFFPGIAQAMANQWKPITEGTAQRIVA